MMCSNGKTLVLKPRMPFWHLIPGGLYVGKMIEIRGTVPYGADTFQINLTAGEDQVGYQVDRLLHLSIRFTQHQVVRNALLSSVWGPEETDGGLPFASGKSFIMLILVEQSSYRIAVDGKHQWEFFHRSDLGRASHIYIDGFVKIEEVKFYDKFNQVPQIGTCVPMPVGIPGPQTINDPPIPFYHPIAGGLRPGMMVMISARPSASAHKFTINFQTGNSPYPPADIGFHIDVRFYTSSVVRNTRTNGVWEMEESYIPYFPFAHAARFDMIIKVDGDKFLVAVNGQNFFDFNHRSFPLSKFDTLFIENDIIISSIRFDFC